MIATPSPSPRPASCWRRILWSAIPCLLLTWTPAMAAPVAVTLSPQGCLVTERLDMPATGTLTFSLPEGADPEHLALAPRASQGDAAVTGVSWKRVPQVDAAALAALRRKVEDAVAARDVAAARLAAVDGQVQYWKTLPGFTPEAAKEVSELSGELGRQLAALGEARVPLARQWEALDREARRLEAELAQTSGSARQIWEVTVAAAGGKALSLEARYPVQGCGWTPLYRLDARPEARQVRFAFEAQAWQRTGQDWRGVALTLVTALPRRDLAPPPLPDWIIQKRPDPKPQARMLKAPAAPQAMEAAIDLDAVGGGAPAPAMAPVPEAHATYTAWDLGTRDLPAGQSPRLTVAEQTWPAVFRHTLRPAQGPAAFLTANASLPMAMDLPAGEALFLVDGALAGRDTLALAGNQTDLFFGESPRLRCVTELVARESGQKGLLGSRQTHRWAWRFEVTNQGKAPALVRLEEPAPQRRDERMEISLASTPPAQRTGDNLLVWEQEIPPGGVMTIRHDIGLVAPADMALDVGWR